MTGLVLAAPFPQGYWFPRALSPCLAMHDTVTYGGLFITGHTCWLDMAHADSHVCALCGNSWPNRRTWAATVRQGTYGREH